MVFRVRRVGTEPYLAPEIRAKNDKHDQCADIWSLGIVLYELFTLTAPFGEEVRDFSKVPSFKMIMHQQSRTLIQMILVKEMKKRPSVSEIMNKAASLLRDCPATLRIGSWNINGLRSSIESTDLFNYINKQNPDIICLQELRMTHEQCESVMEESSFKEKVAKHYLVYHNCSSSSSQKKTQEATGGGGGGVMVLTKIAPIKVSIGFKNRNSCNNKKREFNQNVITLRFKKFTLVGVYAPKSVTVTATQTKQDARARWDLALLNYLQGMQLKKPKQALIVIGDFNVCHSMELDVHPDLLLLTIKNLKESNQASSRSYCKAEKTPSLPAQQPEQEEEEGQTPNREKKTNNLSTTKSPFEEVTKNFERLLHCTELVDTFRRFHPNAKKWTYWNNQYQAREEDRGRRLDYALVDMNLMKNRHIKNSSIIDEIKGSDHCPIEIDLEENYSCEQ